MIAKDSGTGRSFVGLARYLLEGKKGEKADRVMWSGAERLPTDDVMTAARLMQMNANDNTRVEKPVYHFSINWRPEESDRVSRDLALEIAREAMRDLGLQEHEALIVAHRDTEHFHVHVVANRIHPGTNKSWKQGLSKIVLEKSMARLSLEHGFEVVAGHHNAADLGVAPPEPENTMATEAIRFTERTGEASALERAHETAAPVFARAETWRDLRDGLAEAGWSLERRGRGLVLVAGEGAFVKPSSLGREYGRAALEARFGEPFRDAEPAAEANRSSDRPKQPETRTAELGFAGRVARYVAPRVRAATSWPELSAELRKVGLEVAAKGRGLVVTDGSNEAKMSAINRAFSRARLEDRFGQTFAEYAARADRPMAIVKAKRSAIRLDQAVRALEAWHKRREQLDGLLESYARLMERTEPARRIVNDVGRHRKAAARAWDRIYRDPEKAHARFEAYRKKHGHVAALRKAAGNPGKFGKLQGRGLPKDDARRQALHAHDRFLGAYRDWRLAVQTLQENKAFVDAAMKERRESPLRRQIDELTRSTGMKEDTRRAKRRDLERAVLDASGDIAGTDLRSLPLMSDLRRAVVRNTVESLRDERAAYYARKYRHSDIGCDAVLPTNARPDEARAHGAAEAFASARRTWLTRAMNNLEQIEAWREAREAMQGAAEKVRSLGEAGRSWLKRFGIEPRSVDGAFRRHSLQAKTSTLDLKRGNYVTNGKSRDARRGLSLELGLNLSKGERKS